MAVKISKPITNARRSYSVASFKDTITHTVPEKSLVTSLKKTGGRNNQGKITTRHIGGGHKKAYRLIDFKRSHDDIVGTIKTIEYDPNRSSYIALVHYMNGAKAYILAAKGFKVGQKIISSEKTEISVGNHLCLKNIPEGMLVHNVELTPRTGGKLARSAGNFAQVLGFSPETGHVIIRLKSGETRKVLENCRATIGEVGNSEYNLISYGKAGRNRWRGIRPTVRGSVMNPNDHPHGGGEGRSPIGKDAPRTPWGKKALGVLTRNIKKPSQKLLVRRAKNKVVR